MNYDFGGGCGSLLHLACALGLPEVMQTLVKKSQSNTKIWSMKDREGKTHTFSLSSTSPIPTPSSNEGVQAKFTFSWTKFSTPCWLCWYECVFNLWPWFCTLQGAFQRQSVWNLISANSSLLIPYSPSSIPSSSTHQSQTTGRGSLSWPPVLMASTLSSPCSMWVSLSLIYVCPYHWSISLCLVTFFRQSYRFDVNREHNADGEFLIHVAIKGGQS